MAGKEMAGLTGLTFNSSSAYTVVQEIGRGGMGIVFLAEKDCEGVIDYVVLKTIRTLSDEHEASLKREANIATGLRHENIVKTYGLESIGVSDLPDEFRQEINSLSFDRAERREVRTVMPGRRLFNTKQHRRTPLRPALARPKEDDRKLYLMVMDYVEGTDLRTLHFAHLRRRLLVPCPLAAFAISRICRALSYAHQFLVHRDISPENILINNQGVSKLSDFGIAVTGADALQQFAGKLTYMSPEQLARQPVDARSDIFSLGLVLYQVLTGISLHKAPSGLAFEEQLRYVQQRMAIEIPPPHQVREDIPEVLSNMTMRMLAKDLSVRYQRAEDCGNDLEMKYMYAEGFGPTNNSLAAYMTLFEEGFRSHSQDQLRQLKFLKNAEGKIELQRRVSSEEYTQYGREIITTQEGSPVYEAVLRPMTASTPPPIPVPPPIPG